MPDLWQRVHTLRCVDLATDYKHVAAWKCGAGRIPSGGVHQIRKLGPSIGESIVLAGIRYPDIMFGVEVSAGYEELPVCQESMP